MAPGAPEAVADEDPEAGAGELAQARPQRARRRRPGRAGAARPCRRRGRWRRPPRRWRTRSRGACGRSARRVRPAPARWSRRGSPAPPGGPCPPRRRARRARALGVTPASATSAPSLLETTLWAIATTVPSRRTRPCGGGDQGRQVVPGADLWQARQRLGAKADTRGWAPGAGRGGSGLRPPWRRARPSSARVRGAPPELAGEPPAQRVEVGVGVDVEQQRRRALHAQPAPLASTRERWRSKLPARSRGRSRRGVRAAGRWCRCRDGRGRSPPRGPARRLAPSSSCSSEGDSAGQSPGTHRTRSKPARRACSTPSEAAADWPSSRWSSTTISPGAPGSGSRAGR